MSTLSSQPTKTLPGYIDQCIDRYSVAIVFWGLSIILLVTLLPFNFSVDDLPSREILWQTIIVSTTSYDVLANIFLFVPFGFGLASQLRVQLGGLRLLKVTLIALGLSFGIEALQFFLPSRDPSLIDVLTNASGGLLGGWIFVQWRIKWVEHLLRLITIVKPHLSLRKLLILLATYTALILSVSANLYNDSHLSHWDTHFPLVVGNELTGDRPWNGSVSDFYMADRTASEAEVNELMTGHQPTEVLRHSLLANYQLVGKGNYQDRMGYLPELVWQGATLKLPANASVQVSRDHWLFTKIPVTSMIERIRQTSQFTLMTTVATSNIDQTGPARIVSVSVDRWRRNFTLGQQNSQLIFRIRTPLSGDNGTIRVDDGTNMVFPSVFADTNPHRIILTYGGSVLKLYVDTVRQVYTRQWTPETRLFQTLVTLNIGQSNINGLVQLILKLIYYGILFVPIGLLLAILSMLLTRSFSAQLFFICICIFLPPVLMESNRMLIEGSRLQPVNLLLSVAIEVSTAWSVKTRVIPWFNTCLSII